MNPHSYERAVMVVAVDGAPMLHPSVPTQLTNECNSKLSKTALEAMQKATSSRARGYEDTQCCSLNMITKRKIGNQCTMQFTP